MPTARSSVAFAEYHGMLFLAGGECRADTNKAFDNVEAYDTKTNGWKTFAALPTPRHGFAAAVADDKLFFFGGSTRCGGGGKIADVEQLSLK
jgi:N-acetylneuraminic acid mutarotase